MWFSMSTKELKFSPLREFCNDLNRWKSEGATSGEYGGWDSTCQPSFNAFCRVIKDTWRRALSLWNMTHFRLASSGHFCSIAVFNSANCEQYLFEFISWLFGRSLWYSILFQFQQTPSMAFFGWRSAFGVAKGNSFHFRKIFSAQHCYK